MKKSLIFIFASALFFACGSDQAASDNSTTEASTSIEKATVQAVDVAKETVEKVVDTIKVETEAAKENISKKVAKKVEKAPVKKEKPKVVAKAAPKPKPAPVAKPKQVRKVEPPKPATFSNIQFSNSKHNFGRIDQGESIDVTFNFTNTGNADLQIMNAEASCGCTTPSFPFLPIKPGETGKIEVTYNSTGKLGPQRPTVTLTTNDAKKTHKLYLEGYVMAELAQDTSN